MTDDYINDPELAHLVAPTLGTESMPRLLNLLELHSHATVHLGELMRVFMQMGPRVADYRDSSEFRKAIEQHLAWVKAVNQLYAETGRIQHEMRRNTTAAA